MQNIITALVQDFDAAPNARRKNGLIDSAIASALVQHSADSRAAGAPEDSTLVLRLQALRYWAVNADPAKRADDRLSRLQAILAAAN